MSSESNFQNIADQLRRFALKLTDIVPLDSPIPFKSRQGKLLDVPDEIIQAIEAIALT
jgi:hypothetical protein